MVNIGIDTPSVNKSLNELLRATVTRIRRVVYKEEVKQK